MPRKKPGKVAAAKSEIVAELPLACTDERTAVEFMEKRRWNGCPCCPHCGSVAVYQMKDAQSGERSKRFLWRCRDCKRQFTVRVGTVFEDSRIPLRHWCYAFWAACASKKGVSAKQIQRMTGVSYKSALFMMHRIRFAMAPDPTNAPKLVGIVEADETYVGGKPRYPMGDPRRKAYRDKTPVFAVVQRGGEVRARVMPEVTGDNIREALLETVEPHSYLMTDDSSPYNWPGKHFAAHRVIRHKGRVYVDGVISTNTIEGFFALLKRGIIGTYHAVSRKHLHRYVSEFEFRYNTRGVDDGERTARAIQGAQGKRLVYREAKAG